MTGVNPLTVEAVKTKFSSTDGAIMLADIDSLEAALTSLFYFRAYNNLEIVAENDRLLDIPDLTTCTTLTREAGLEI